MSEVVVNEVCVVVVLSVITPFKYFPTEFVCEDGKAVSILIGSFLTMQHIWLVEAIVYKGNFVKWCRKATNVPVSVAYVFHAFALVFPQCTGSGFINVPVQGIVRNVTVCHTVIVSVPRNVCKVLLRQDFALIVRNRRQPFPTHSSLAVV